MGTFGTVESLDLQLGQSPSYRKLNPTVLAMTVSGVVSSVPLCSSAQVCPVPSLHFVSPLPGSRLSPHSLPSHWPSALYYSQSDTVLDCLSLVRKN